MKSMSVAGVYTAEAITEKARSLFREERAMKRMDG